jgi:ABC-type bacteriocin/lantibiotic exporter with double-glycine peptidase domain
MTAEDRPTGPEPRVAWRVLLEHARPEWPRLAVAVVLGIVITLVSLAQPLAVREIVDRVMDSDPVGIVIVVVVGLFVVEAALGAVQSFLLGRSGERIVMNLRIGLVGRLLRWPMAHFDRARAGDLISRVNADTSQVRGALATSLAETVTGVLTFVGAILLMFIIDPLMLGITLACVGVAAVAVFLVSLRVMIVTLEAQRQIGRAHV